MWHHVWHWILDFTGVNNTYDSFSTHMYNFWSGFGGNVSLLALLGTIVAVYRHHRKYLSSLNPINIVKAPLHIVHNKDKTK
jgi:hypothetical protein